MALFHNLDRACQTGEIERLQRRPRSVYAVFAQISVPTPLGRWVVVLVCYLDDSGKDPQNRIITVAGYAATDDQWRAFEIEVQPIFADYAVKVLHAKDLHNSDGEFRKWTVLKKQTFLARICRAMSHHVPLGMSMSALKTTYKSRAAESGRKRTVTPYTFCFNVIIDWVLTDVRVGRIANTKGVSFILECGHENNAEAEENFYEVRRLHKLEGTLRSIGFVPKESCRAIQVADLFAFYSRRHGVAMEKAPLNDRMRVRTSPGVMLNIITESVPHRAYVATDFGPSAAGSRFFGGDR
jgi:Protein of unknown function (DUF3800)